MQQKIFHCNKNKLFAFITFEIINQLRNKHLVLFDISDYKEKQ